MSKRVNFFDSLPDSAYVRERQLVGRSGGAERALLPFSSSTLWRTVKAGTFPEPIKLSTRVTAWRVGDVRAWIKAKS
jgi:prophage regulatory protein